MALDGLPDIILEDVFTPSSSQAVSGYIAVASMVLYIYEHAITLSTEISVIWNRRPTYANVLFFVTRYASLAWAILFIIGLHVKVHSDSPCRGIFLTYGGLTVLSLTAIRTTFLLRTYALWERNFFVIIVLAPIVVVNTVFNTRVVVKAQELFIPSLNDPLTGQCAVTFARGLRTPAYSITLFYDTVVFILTIWRTFSLAKRAKSAHLRHSLGGLLLRDGSLYYTMVLFLDLLAICADVIKESPLILADISWDFLNVLQAVTAIRLVLNLHIAGHRREMRYGTDLSTGSTFLRFGHSRTVSPMTFAQRRVLGDLGELLSLESSSDDGAIELELGYFDESLVTDDSGLSKDPEYDEPNDAKARLGTVEKGI